MPDNTIESLKSGETYSPTSIARILGKNPSTIWRWMNKGVVVRGRRLKLAATRVGGRIHITENDINAYLHRLNQQDAEDAVADAPRSSAPSEAERFCVVNNL